MADSKRLNELGLGFRMYQGDLRKQIRSLLDDGREFVPPKIVMELRLYAPEPPVRTAWQLGNLVPNMGVMRSPDDKEVKFFIDPPLLYTINPDTELVDHALPTEFDQYMHDKHTGNGSFILTREEAWNLSHDPRALPKIRAAFWDFLAEGDSKLVSAYREMQNTFETKNVMRIYSPESRGFHPVGLSRVTFGSNVHSIGLDNESYRVVGISQEALQARRYARPGGGQIL